MEIEPLSGLFLSFKELRVLLEDRRGVHFINGATDEAWPPEQTQWAIDKWKEEKRHITATLHVLDEIHTHFQYFDETNKKWPHVRNVICDILSEMKASKQLEEGDTYSEAPVVSKY